MLPPLLSLLLECAKKTDQTVVSIALGALVHLIEVGGHQFSDGDWETLLKSIRYFLKFLFLPIFFYFSLFIYLLLLISLVRDASYTTQPLELLNSLGFQKSNNQQLLSREESNAHGNSYHGSRGEPSISNNGEHSHPEAGPQTSLENSEGIMI